MSNEYAKFNKAVTELFDRNLSDHQKMANSHCQLLVVYGSYAHGTQNEESDVDLRGVFVPPKEYYFGLSDVDAVSFKRENREEVDVLYSVKRFFKLASQGRTGVVDLLFVDPQLVLSTGTHGNFLLKNKHVFLSQKCVHSMLGFANANIEKVMKQGSDKAGKPLAHSFRLLFQAKKLLETLTFELQLDKGDLDIYAATRSGELNGYDALELLVPLKDEVERMLNSSKLPKEVDTNEVNKILVDYTDMVLKEGR